MADMRKLLYVFRGKLEITEIEIFELSARTRQLIRRTGSVMYTIGDCGTVLQYGPNYWIEAVDVPVEVKLAAILIN